jgi:hypothetical protein
MNKAGKSNGDDSLYLYGQTVLILFPEDFTLSQTLCN